MVAAYVTRYTPLLTNTGEPVNENGDGAGIGASRLSMETSMSLRLIPAAMLPYASFATMSIVRWAAVL